MILTNLSINDILLTDRRHTDFLSVNLAQSRFGKLNRIPSINRNAPFLLGGKMISRKEKYYRYIKLKPWSKNMTTLRNRCKNSPFYNGEIKLRRCLITMVELEKLWFRDKAWLLKVPSVDRINNNGDYTYENCRFIERDENSRLGNIGKKLPIETKYIRGKAHMKTHCKYGHPLAEGNLYYKKIGRECKSCKIIRGRAWARKARGYKIKRKFP